MPNRLAAERSPYLLQHADNPVEWYPWGQEAFDKARELDRPIFLSIGYSTCHWCHVMAHESFESQAMADILNRDFVSIKVDREERPDVDRVYMTFVQATTGSGGWPMSVWLTPDLKPFYGGTYFPPDARWGRPGFPEILREIVRVWQMERAKVQLSAENLTEQIRGLRSVSPGGDVPDADALKEGVAQFAQNFDQARGGFGGAPKFPRPSELLFLLRETARTGDYTPAFMVAKTLQPMALGGMRDHVGGGFHRYSVDANWRVPHFEKMLYDQAQITLACLETYQLAADRFFADVAEDTLEYVMREMTNPEGGFFSAEDADSVPPEDASNPHAHKTEGAFYLWTQAELEALLKDDFDVFRHRFGIRPDGNAPEDPQGEFTGKNLLYVASTIEEVAQRTGTSREEVEASLQRSRMVLFQARLSRPRPHLDDKVLTGWNGLMLAAFAKAARVLPGAGARARYLEAAERSAQFLEQHMWDASRQIVKRRYRDGDTAIDGYAEDYAYLDLRPDRAVSGRRRSALARMGARAAEAAGRAVLGRRKRRVVQYDGRRSERDPANEGRLRRRGAVTQLDIRAEPADARAPDQRGRALRAHRSDAEDVRAANRQGGARGADDACRAVDLPCKGRAGRHRRTSERGGDAGAHAGGCGEIRSVQRASFRSSPASRAKSARADAAVHQRDEMRDGRPTAYVCHDFTCTEPATDPAGLAERLSRTIAADN